jgi:hypothetical protein
MISYGALSNASGLAIILSGATITSPRRTTRALFPDTRPNFYDPLTVLSFCAANTCTIRFRTAVAVLPMRDPFWLPKQATSIKQLSGGCCPTSQSSVRFST